MDSFFHFSIIYFTYIDVLNMRVFVISELELKVSGLCGFDFEVWDDILTKKQMK